MKLICALFAGIAVSAFSAAARSQEWPVKPVRVIAPVPAATAPDLLVRVVTDRLAIMWGQGVVVDNRPGAGGIVANVAAAKAPADGYTLLLGIASTVAVTPHLFKNPGFDVDRDFVPVTYLGGGPMLIAANNNLPAKNLADVLRLARAQPDKVSIGSPQVGSIAHLTGELINQSSNVKLFSVPFNGTTPAVTAAINNDTQLVIDGVASIIGFVRSGRLKAIAVTSAQPLPGLEDLPLAKDALPDMVVYGWLGFFAPKGTPSAVIEKVNRETNRVLAMPEVVARWREFGFYPDNRDAKGFERFVQEEQMRWAQIVKRAGIQPQ